MGKKEAPQKQLKSARNKELQSLLNVYQPSDTTSSFVALQNNVIHESPRETDFIKLQEQLRERRDKNQALYQKIEGMKREMDEHNQKLLEDTLGQNALKNPLV